MFGLSVARELSPERDTIAKDRGGLDAEKPTRVPLLPTSCLPGGGAAMTDWEFPVVPIAYISRDAGDTILPSRIGTPGFFWMSRPFNWDSSACRDLSVGVGRTATSLDATVELFVETPDLPLPLPGGTAETGLGPLFDCDRVDGR